MRLLIAGLSLGVPLAASAQNAPVAGSPSPAARAARPLSLDEALRLAESQSEAVQIARAGLKRANGQEVQARSQYLPQVSATGAYARTLRSQFSGLSGGSAPADTTPQPQSVCAPKIPATATPAERQAALAQATTCQASGGINFSKVGFGALNQWTLGLNVSQSVFSGGRVSGQNRAAVAGARAATIEVAAQKAQLALDVAQAYYDAQLADRLVSIAQASLTQTEDVLRQTTVARQVGNQSEFDLLRAQVTRDNQVPVLIQRRSDRELAYLRLKQILDVPLDDSLELTTRIDSAGPVLPAIAAAMRTPGASPTPGPTDTSVASRAPVRELEQNVAAQEGLLRVARAERMPQVAITSGYSRLFFPTTVFPQLSDFRENWTVGASVSLPLFTGGRIHGDEMVAEANLEEARARLDQTRKLAALDARTALNQLAQAEAVFAASRGTSQQALRAYGIDQIRFREGISTQTDLAQSRLLVEQAEANRAVAARDLAVARIRLALLRDLPLQSAGSQAQARATSGAGAAGAVGGSSSGAQGGTGQQQGQQQQTTTRSASASAGGTSGSMNP